MSGRVTDCAADGRSIDGVVIARPSAIGVSTSTILEDVERTWVQIRKRCGGRKKHSG